MTFAAQFSRLGFDAPRLQFSARTALAACVALFVAWLLRLEHPQWSAMTVWAASQPTRGQLLEKSFFRILGTIGGAVVGVLLVTQSVGHPAALVVGLAAWTGACVAIGNLQRGFVAYGAMLAGYSAAMVALLDTAHPREVFALGADRLLTVTVGVATALAVGWLFTSPQAEDLLAGRVRRLSARVMRDLAARLRGAPAGPAGELPALLSEMAALEEMLEPHGAGSLRSRRAVRSTRALLMAEMSALLWLRNARLDLSEEAVGAALTEAAQALEASSRRDEAIRAIERAADLSPSHPRLREALVTIETAMRDQLGVPVGDATRPRLHQPVLLHRDWAGARQAAIRSAGAMLFMGAVWIATGWSGGPFLLLGVAIMTSLFSTFENPALTMRHIFVGQIFGAVGALACRWLAWPLATNQFELLLAMLPFILVGALFVSHRRTLAAGFDYNMVMLLLLQPAYPPLVSVGQSLGAAAAVVSGPLVAMAIYRLVYPVDLRRRTDALIAAMVHEIAGIAAARGAPETWPVWRARLYHRLLRLVRLTEKGGQTDAAATEAGLAVLGLGVAILRIHELLREPGVGAETARRLEAVLKRMRNIAREPERAGAALALAARRLSRLGRRREADAIAAAAEDLAANLWFFRRTAGAP